MRHLMVNGFFLCVFPFLASAQCDSWNNKVNKEDLIQDHVIYKGFLKEDKWAEAFPYWEKVYHAAPMADGKRNDHFYDGQQFYLKKFEGTTNVAERAEYLNKAMLLFDQEAACTGKSGSAMARKGYYQFYHFNVPYTETFQSLKTAIDADGMNTEYIALVPMAYVLADHFKNKRVSIEEARKIYSTLYAIADHQIAAKGTYADYYQQSKDAMMPTLESIEGDLFDCTWFKNKLEPEYRADPNNGEKIKEIFQTLTRQGCLETDPLVAELKAKWEVYAAEVNAKLLAEFHAKNPFAHAKALATEGKYNEAINKFNDALNAETDPVKKAEIYYEMAGVEFRQMERYTSARDHARKAFKLRPDWGLPLLLIGDMYARSYRSCGNSDFEQRCVILAAIEKYQEAKAIDPSIASQANERIARYNASKPLYEDAHMLGKKEGDSYTVGCWIGETVALRFNK